MTKPPRRTAATELSDWCCLQYVPPLRVFLPQVTAPAQRRWALASGLLMIQGQPRLSGGGVNGSGLDGPKKKNTSPLGSRAASGRSTAGISAIRRRDDLGWWTTGGSLGMVEFLSCCALAASLSASSISRKRRVGATGSTSSS